LVQDFIGLVEVFLASDTTSVPAGTRWLEEIVEGLQRSQIHIIICSNYSVYRPWINYEAGAAGVRGIPIVPLCHSGLIPDQLPVPLSESEGGIITHASALLKLYTRVASFIGSAVPAVNFEKYATEFRAIEEQFGTLVRNENTGADLMSEVTASLEKELIKDPHVLCVTSPQFRELGYANQLQRVLDAFPKNIRHDFVLSSSELKQILLEERVDIIHVAGFVEDVDLLDADVLVALIKKANTRLVVLGGSASLVLAAQLLPVTNVIAARDMVSARAMASWVETFYKALMTEPLATAIELASHVSQAPMKLYAQQRYVPSLKVELSGT
jgi:hypothetical protein